MPQPAPPALTIFDKEGKPAGEMPTPSFLTQPVRKDLVKRAYLAAMSASRQPQGRDPMAGKRTSAESMGVGLGLARVPRVRDGRGAAFAPMTVGGRRTHPPRPETIIHENINSKEKQRALAAAIAATAARNLVEKRGHIVSQVSQFPILLDNEVENFGKTSEVKRLLMNVGLWPDVERAIDAQRIRAGKGKRRGRKYTKPKSVLLVVGEDKGLYKAARNLPGVEVVSARNLSVLHLARGGQPGRLTAYTQSALGHLNQRLVAGAL